MLKHTIGIIGYISLGVCLLAISGRFTWDITWSEVHIPITLQSIVLISLNQLFPRHLGWISTMIWLVLATLGLHVLADGASGVDWVNGKSSGYLLGFVLAALFLNQKSRLQRKGYGFRRLMKEQVSATIIILLCGFIFLWSHIGIENAFQFGILPFLFGGLLKTIFGSIIVRVIIQANFKKTCI